MMATAPEEDLAIYEKRKDNLRFFLDNLPLYPCKVPPNFNLCTVCFKINIDVARGCPIYRKFHEGLVDEGKTEPLHVELARSIDLGGGPKEEIPVPEELEKEFPLFEFTTPTVKKAVFDEPEGEPPKKVKPRVKVKPKIKVKPKVKPKVKAVKKKIKKAKVVTKPKKKVKVKKVAKLVPRPPEAGDARPKKVKKKVKVKKAIKKKVKVKKVAKPVSKPADTDDLDRKTPGKPEKPSVPPLFAALGNLETKKKKEED